MVGKKFGCSLNVGSTPSLFSHIDMQQHMRNPSAGFQQAIASQPVGFKQGLAPKRKAAQLVAEHQELEDPDDVLSRQVQHQMEVGFRALSSSLSSQLQPLLQLLRRYSRSPHSGTRSCSMWRSRTRR